MDMESGGMIGGGRFGAAAADLGERLRLLEEEYAALTAINIRQEKRIEKLHSNVNELVGLYLVFQGIIFTSVSQASTLRCHNWWLPFSLSSIAAIAIFLSLFHLLLSMSRSKLELELNRTAADRLHHLIMMHKFLIPSSNSRSPPPVAAAITTATVTQGYQSISPFTAAATAGGDGDDDHLQYRAAFMCENNNRVSLPTPSPAPSRPHYNHGDVELRSWQTADFGGENSNLVDFRSRFGGRESYNYSLQEHGYGAMDPVTTSMDQVYPYAYSCVVLVILITITAFVLLACRRLLCNRS